MNEQDIHNMLVAGLPIEIDGVGAFTPLAIKDVFAMGESVYNLYVSKLLVDKSQFEEEKELKEYSNFELLLVLMSHDEQYRKDVMTGLELFFNQQANLYIDDHDVFLYFQDIQHQINQNNFEHIQHLIRLANFLKIEKDEKEEFNFANERARKMWERIQKNKKKKPQPKQEINLHSLYSSISCRFGDYEKVKNMTIYQTYDAFQRLNNVDNVQNTYQGIYSGTIDGKKIKQSDLNWAKIIQDK